jgi:hypothetical protein
MLKRLLVALVAILVVVIPTTVAVASTPVLQLTISGSSSTPRCGEYWSWKVYRGTSQWSAVKWTENSCGWAIQDRSRCWANVVGNKYYYSGIVVGAGIWDRATCGSNRVINAAAAHVRVGGTWDSYGTYWP